MIELIQEAEYETIQGVLREEPLQFAYFVTQLPIDRAWRVGFDIVTVEGRRFLKDHLLRSCGLSAPEIRDLLRNLRQRAIYSMLKRNYENHWLRLLEKEPEQLFPFDNPFEKDLGHADW